jgi:hypothetical protein
MGKEFLIVKLTYGICSEVTSMENWKIDTKKELSQMSSDQCYYRVRLNTKKELKQFEM